MLPAFFWMYNFVNLYTTNYEIRGTPEIIVNGKYRVSSSLTGSLAKMLEVVDFLINKEHKKINNLNY